MFVRLSMILALFLFSFMMSCTDSKSSADECGEQALIELYDLDASLFEGAIQGVVIDGDCMTVEFAASGCDGTSWVTSLYSHPSYIKTSPPERFARLDLANFEECEAFITQSVDFDISSMQIEGEDELKIQLAGYDRVISYQY